MHSIGTASKRSGVHIETIRYYEREGILPPAERTASGRRVYDEDGIARLRFIRHCRELGFAIRDAQALLSLTAAPMPCAEAQLIAQRNLDTVRSKIAELSVMERELSALVDQCGTHDKHCAILNDLFAED
ncbi:helix-turn-helix domain-containing protein [Hoeflea sp. TYP-13]|uniref:helix-turn-helix domain-containing protein n=1 Tax=Hoeflea sp. TYP-13 TaxID=3230023 RepID=UPI0034C6CBB1